MNALETKHFTQGMLFQVRITSRYISIMGSQVFQKLKLGINFEDYLILDVLSYNKGICQRDLAKMLLRDRSNTCKIISNLENEKLITIKSDIRNNRNITRLFITKKGQKLCDKVFSALEPYAQTIFEQFDEQQQNTISKSLKDFRTILEKTIETQI